MNSIPIGIFSIQISILISILFSCGTAGNNLSRGGKCIGNGDECHEQFTDGSPSPGPSGALGKQGNSGIPGKDGAIGPTGSPGPSGSPGTDGSSCSVVRVIGGSIISCTDGTIGVILDGQDGVSAPPTPYTVTSLYDPCGHQSSYDEVLLRLANGQLLAHYASGALQYLTIVGPGNYVTTDGTHCYFTVDSDLGVSNEHN